LAYFFYIVATTAYWNAGLVSLAVVGCAGTSTYVNTYFYYLGAGHWMGYLYAAILGYRCYFTFKIVIIAFFVLSYVACWIMGELNRIP